MEKPNVSKVATYVSEKYFNRRPEQSTRLGDMDTSHAPLQHKPTPQLLDTDKEWIVADDKSPLFVERICDPEQTGINGRT